MPTNSPCIINLDSLGRLETHLVCCMASKSKEKARTYGILIVSECYIHMNLNRELKKIKLLSFSIEHNIKICYREDTRTVNT